MVTCEEPTGHQPLEQDQIAFFRPLICTSARRNPVACRTNQGDRKGRSAPPSEGWRCEYLRRTRARWQAAGLSLSLSLALPLSFSLSPAPSLSVSLSFAICYTDGAVPRQSRGVAWPGSATGAWAVTWLADPGHAFGLWCKVLTAQEGRGCCVAGSATPPLLRKTKQSWHPCASHATPPADGCQLWIVSVSTLGSAGGISLGG